MFRPWMAALVLLVASTQAGAFESWEHKRLGDLAYHIAWNVFCDKHRTAPECLDRASAARGALTEGSLRQLHDPYQGSVRMPTRDLEDTTYGDVVMCVDYFLTPDKLIAGRESTLISPKPDKSAGGAVREDARLFPTNRDQFDIAVQDRCNDKLLNLEGARSGHVNHTHFQAELLVAQRHNHMLALSMRTMENNLFSALVLNAVSDHFLQDTFAPGHITTWRSRLTDLAANAYHDRVNRKGWPARFKKENFNSLLTMRSASGPEFDLAVLVADQLRAKNGAGEYYLQADFFLPRENKECLRSCREGARFDVRTDHADLLTKVRHDLDADNVEYLDVVLRGDGDLWSDQHDAQRFLMLLFQVRSIIDVLQSGTENANAMTFRMVDSFRGSTWHWEYINESTEKKGLLARGFLPPVRPTSLIKARVGALDYEMQQEGDLKETQAKKTLSYRDMDQVFGVSFGADNMTFGDAQTRYVANIETVVWGRARASRSANFALTVGVQPFKSHDFSGFAVGTRLVSVMPEIETSISIPFRYVHVKALDGNAKWKPTIGLRIDAGFTSFLTFYLQVVRDSAAQFDGGIKSGYSLGAGIQLAAPRCRIPLVKNTCRE